MDTPTARPLTTDEPRADEPSSVREARRIQLRTQCIYAAKSRIWGSPAWNEARTLEQNVAAVVPDLAAFVDASRDEALDGYALELPERFGGTLAALARTTRAVLFTLSELDPAGGGCMARPVEDPGWCFEFGGERFFVNTFAPCYDEGNSRYGFGSRSTFILLQPRHSFAKAVRPGDSVLPDAVRGRIRADFAAQGRPYDTAISSIPFEAWRVIRPLRAGDPPVRWWEA
jgi:hypothetical protein